VAATLRRDEVGGVGAYVYRQARATTVLAGRWVDTRLAPLGATAPHRLSSAEREAVLAALNGLFGDLLARLDNPLAIRMALRRHGKPLVLEQSALAAAIPDATGKLLILVHGLCRCDLQWRRGGHDHGAALGRDLGYTPLYLHYNSGLHVSVNGRELSALLDVLVGQWPVAVEELAIVGHSMGGLVARSACHYAKSARHAWRPLLRQMIFLGTPHHGAPLERHGNWLGAVLGRSTLTAPLARLGEMRSAGITDLRYGNLLDEDWRGRGRFEHDGDLRRKVPLPKGVRCYTIAGSTGRRPGDMRDRLLGDGLIPVDTALGRHEDPARSLAFPKSRQSIAFGIHHLDLLSRVEVYEKMREWLA
jgi:pimeloyl-ACP methyl ester carboxylesterase